jgi:thiol:disulfide interchange protein
MPAVGLAVPFVFGIGMGILWIAAGATMGKILPKPGKWMVYVKNIMAIFIALFGIYYLYIGITLIPGRYDSVKEIENWQTALNEAKNKKCPVFVDFWASWCKNCAYMDKNVLENQQVKDKLSAYVVVKFQAENLKDPNVAAILEKYNIQGLPAFVILKEKRQ